MFLFIKKRKKRLVFIGAEIKKMVVFNFQSGVLRDVDLLSEF